MINRRCFHNQGADKAPTRTCRRFQLGEVLSRGLLDCENRLIVCSSIYYLQLSPGVDCLTSAPWPWLSTTTATEAGRLLTLYSVYCGPAKISDGADKNILTPPPQPFTSFFMQTHFPINLKKSGGVCQNIFRTPDIFWLANILTLTNALLSADTLRNLQIYKVRWPLSSSWYPY